MKEKSPKKGIALKATKEDCNLDEEDPTNNDEEAFTLIVQGLKKIALKKRFNQRGFNKKESAF